MKPPEHAKTVVLATFTLQGGGAERFVLTLAQAFAQLGYQAHVVSFKQQVDYTLPEGVHYHFLNYQAYRWLPKGAWRYRIFARVFDRYVRSHIGSPQLTLSNLYQVDNVLHYSRLPHIVYVLHNTASIEYGLAQHPHRAAALAALYANHPLVGVSRGVVADYGRHVATHPYISAIHNPIDRQSIAALSTAFKPEMAAGYIVHVGRFKLQKDHALLIRAYAQSSTQVPLVLVGTGPEMAACQALAVTLGVADRVIFAGFQANPYPFIRHAGLMVLSSRFEGFGIVIAEALALGVPVVSTDCESGPRELLPTHCLVPVGDVAALANKINQALAQPQHFATAFDESWLPEAVAHAYLAAAQMPKDKDR